MDDTLPEGKVSSMTVCGSLRRQSVSPRNGSLAQTLYGRSSIGAGAFAAITTQALSTDRAEFLRAGPRSEEHTSELQSLMSISYAVFCLKKKKEKTTNRNQNDETSNTHTKNI